jgi:hypothetical protein
MKNKGCLIAGCAGAAIIGVVVVVICAALGIYAYNQGQAKKERQEYRPSVETTHPPLPVGATLDDQKKVQMVLTTLDGFQAGIRTGTFQGFYDAYVSDLWKAQISAAQLDKSFGTFLASRIELSPASFAEAPVFTKDEKEGPQVRFAGHYTVKNANGASRVTWELHYILEASRGWGLTRINIALKPFTEL